jgi:hypothetical protein
MGGTPIVFQQLLYQSPLLLVYLVGLIVAMVMFSRCPRAAMLTIIGTGTLLFVAIGMVVLQTYLISARNTGGGITMQNYSTIIMTSNVIANILRAIAMGLIIAAVFVGRKVVLQVGFPVSPPPFPPR